MPTNTFCSTRAWHPLDNATPTNFPSPKSWVSFFSLVLFVSLLAMVLSEYNKDWSKFFEMLLFPKFLQNDEIYKKLFPLAFFNILKEPLLVQEQTITQKEGLILSFLDPESLWVWHYQEVAMSTCCKKHILLIFYMSADCFWLLPLWHL